MILLYISFVSFSPCSLSLIPLIPSLSAHLCESSALLHAQKPTPFTYDLYKCYIRTKLFTNTRPYRQWDRNEALLLNFNQALYYSFYLDCIIDIRMYVCLSVTPIKTHRVSVSKWIPRLFPSLSDGNTSSLCTSLSVRTRPILQTEPQPFCSRENGNEMPI